MESRQDHYTLIYSPDMLGTCHSGVCVNAADFIVGVWTLTTTPFLLLPFHPSFTFITALLTLPARSPADPAHQPHSLHPNPEEPSSLMGQLLGMGSFRPSINSLWRQGYTVPFSCRRGEGSLLWDPQKFLLAHYYCASKLQSAVVPTSWIKLSPSSDYC